MTLEQKLLSAADFLLECMSSAGLDCVDHNAGSEAWSAHGDLELVASLPAAVLPKYLMLAAEDLRQVSNAHDRVLEQSAAAVRRAQGLTCKAGAVRYVGSIFAARRGLLAAQARRLGLHKTRVGPELAALVEAALFLDGAWLVEARCAGGNIYVLVAQTYELRPDDDPDAYAAGGWEAITAGVDSRRLLRGYQGRVDAAQPKVIDDSPDEAVDAWLPVTRVDL